GIFALLHRHLLASSFIRVIIALAVTSAFAVVGRFARGVSWSGAAAGLAIAFIMAVREPRIFGILLLIFVMTLAATRLGGVRKLQLKVRESEQGRNASQIMANLGVAGLILAMPPSGLTTLLALAALAEAAADTLSSEIGTAFPGATVLLTNWKLVAPGTDGGISSAGTAAGILGSSAVALAAVALGLLSLNSAIMVAAAAVAGMFVDSLLGATLERRGYINNDLVNLRR